MASSAPEPRVVLDELLQLLQCPICTLFMSSPIEQCHNGHCICPDCRKKLQACPSCQAAFTGIRARLVEDMAEKLLLPCENREAGCAVALLRADLESHRDCCPFRKYRCLAGDDRNICMWVGCRENILDHVKEKHGKNCLMQGSNSACQKQISEKKVNFRFCKLIQAHGDIFWHFEIVDVVNKEFYWFVQYIGPKENASKYIYKYVFTSTDGKCEITFTCVTYSDSDVMRDIPGIEKWAHLTFSQARAYMTERDSLEYDIDILKIC